MWELLESRVMLTTVSIQSGEWFLDGAVTNPGTVVQGLLPNARMVQATFDDSNPATVTKWAYPDTGVWDRDRNIREFVAAVPAWHAAGLLAVTLNMQGGSPKADAFGNDQPWRNSAFRSDGTLRSSYLGRMEKAIRGLNANGMVAILGLFYGAQDQFLKDESAVKRAVNGTVDWVLAKGFCNVVIEVDNEADGNYDHSILQSARVTELIDRVKSRSGGKLKVSTSFTGGVIPPDAVIAASDFVLLHGNGQSGAGITSMVTAVREKTTKPIVFNEDSTRMDNFAAAVAARASWGYYDQGTNNYTDGFQSPAVDWGINTPSKHAFFDQLAQYSACVAPITGFTLIDADRDVALGSLTEGKTIDLARLPTRNLAVVAITGDGLVGSVRFDLDGLSRYHIENAPPYALFGDDGAGDYTGHLFASGLRTLTASTYSARNATGLRGDPLTLRFNVIN